ncbi:MAG: type II secretion system protein GspG [Chthoniobacteraceae bacterium]
MQKAKIDWLGWGLIVLFLLFLLGLSFDGLHCPMWHEKEFAARHNLDEMVRALNAYYTEYGVMPKGNDAEVLAALQRKNPRDIMFYEPGSRHLNSKGELLDPWGTPYRIGATKPGYAWAYSCGANKIDEGGAWGSDDVSSWQ